MSNILGFDFGINKIGLAIGNTITCNANPLGIIRSRNSKPNWDEITKVIEEWGPSLFIVGQPIVDNNNDIIIKKAKLFADELSEKYNIKYELVDESYSSIEAYSQYKNLRQHGYKKLNNIDHLAAKIILERWLISHKKSL
tara:strand:- start:1071 stop:1490 length:420 start_codon:yes stop_codon:yes gene_type:complete